MKKKKENRNRIVVSLIILVIGIIALLWSLNLNRKQFVFENILKNFTTTINKTIMKPFTSYNTDKDIDQSESYLIQKNINSSLEKEIQELKDSLELNRTLTEYEPVNATILSRNKSYWFNTINIDKGKKHGIEKDMAVVTKHGLVGKISKVYKNSSEVKLITSDDINFKVSVSIKTNEVDNYAILNGYNPKTDLIKASGIDKLTPINIGDVVLTSGLGKMFPGGIYIGTVEKIESDKYSLSKNIYIKTYQNFNDIHYVTILRTKQ